MTQSGNVTYSTTRNLTKAKLHDQNALNNNLHFVNILTPDAQRVGEGGLRTHGYLKSIDIKHKPLITVLTVVFNGAETLERTILSVINQPYDNIEFIIIDGSSTDNTLDIIRKYEHAIDYWVSESDKGIYDAMNKGWMLSNNESSILFLGSGDQILSLPQHIDNNKIVYGNVRIGKANQYYPSSHEWLLKIGNTLHHQALLVPKRFNLLPPFNLKYKIYADFDFNQRLYKLGYQFVFDPSFISYAEPDGVSAKLNIEEIAAIAFKNFGFFYGILSFFYGFYQVCKIKLKKVKNT